MTAALLLVAASAYPCPTENINTFYSDYFSTEVGGNAFYCDCSSESWGQQTGAYWTNDRHSCNSGGGGIRCYENVSGSWVQITCPCWIAGTC